MVISFARDATSAERQGGAAAAPLLGAPFGTNFRLDTEGKKQDHKLVVDPRTVEQIDDAVGDALAPFQALLAPEFDHGVATVEKGRSGFGCSHHQRQVFFRFQRFSGRSSPADWPR